MRKKLLAGLATGLSIFGVVGIASATTIFFDDFNGENIRLNYTDFSNWTVSDGSVDLIGTGSSWSYFPAYGKYVDMDGSTGDAGKILSTASFNLSAGDYFLQFDLAGNHRNNYSTDQVTVMVNNGITSQNYTLRPSDPFQTFTQSFTLASPTSVRLSFEGVGRDNIGMLLDNIRLGKTDPVPEPATMLLFGSGLAGLAGARLRRKKN